ncbi:MAG: hypothetical protein QOK24_2762 [Verrucomicrobiota bacterium]|jgi:hypothetical protein
MNATLKLEPPFYLPEAIDQFVRPVIPKLLGNEVPASVLDEPTFCEALNRALRFTIEKTR